MEISAECRARALLLAGGLGTRLRPITDQVPKCLVPIAGRPLLDYWCGALEAAGVQEALVNTHHHRDAVRGFLEARNAQGGLHIAEAFEPELLGSAGTIGANERFMDGADDCVVIYADNLSTVDLAALLAFHRGHGDPFTMLVCHMPDPSSRGIAELDGDGRVVSFVEKPEQPRGDLANAGVYVLTAAAWREIADMGAFDIGYDVLPHFVGRMRGFVFDGYHVDIGTLESLEAARRDAPALFGDPLS